MAIAGIIAMRPSILILDEATSMLDPEGRQELIQYIEDIRQQYGMTVLSITHDLDEVAMSNRVLVLKQGKVESISSPVSYTHLVFQREISFTLWDTVIN